MCGFTGVGPCNRFYMLTPFPSWLEFAFAKNMISQFIDLHLPFAVYEGPGFVGLVSRLADQPVSFKYGAHDFSHCIEGCSILAVKCSRMEN
jgi:hypothetical protein